MKVAFFFSPLDRARFDRESAVLSAEVVLIDTSNPSTDSYIDLEMADLGFASLEE